VSPGWDSRTAFGALPSSPNLTCFAAEVQLSPPLEEISYWASQSLLSVPCQVTIPGADDDTLMVAEGDDPSAPKPWRWYDACWGAV